MPKIFVLRHQLAEQQARLRQHDKGGAEASSSPPLSSDEEKFEAERQKLIGGNQPPVPELLNRPPGLVIQPVRQTPTLAGKTYFPS